MVILSRFVTLSVSLIQKVSLFQNTTHIQEIIDSGLPLPAVNQIPYNPHLFRAQAELVALCAKHNVPTNLCFRFACTRCR